jgi:hypothetical protein
MQALASGKQGMLTVELGLMITLGATGWPCLVGVPGPLLTGWPAAPAWGI